MARSKSNIFKGLTTAPILEDIGLEKYLEVVKVEDYIDTVGAKKIFKQLGLARILANLSAEERQKLKEQLN